MPRIVGIYKGGLDRKRDKRLIAAAEKLGGECVGAGSMLETGARDIEFSAPDADAAERVRKCLADDGLEVSVEPDYEPAVAGPSVG